MHAVGTVVEIVGQMILIKADVAIHVDEVFKVFAEVENKELAERHGLTRLHIPKGEVRVVANQSQGFYLAEVFRQPVASERIIEQQRGLLSTIISGSASEVVKETRPGPPSAVFGAPTVSLRVNQVVTVGDRVGRD